MKLCIQIRYAAQADKPRPEAGVLWDYKAAFSPTGSTRPNTVWSKSLLEAPKGKMEVK
jgi:hypothetical protein